MRDTKDFSGVLREGSWVAGCVIAAIAFCYLAPEYGYSSVLFFSVTFYAITGFLRVLFKLLRALVWKP